MSATMISAVTATASFLGVGANGATRPAASAEDEAEKARKVARLREIDRQVRAHEAAHVAAAGGLVTRGAQFTTVRGPDGQSYAVAGEVQIDTTPGKSPEETLQKAERIRAAALAPADPSPQDLKVAAKAAQMAAQARMELAQEKRSDAPRDPTRYRSERALAAYRANGG